jgi:hypothetical protein
VHFVPRYNLLAARRYPAYSNCLILMGMHPHAVKARSCQHTAAYLQDWQECCRSKRSREGKKQADPAHVEDPHVGPGKVPEPQLNSLVLVVHWQCELQIAGGTCWQLATDSDRALSQCLSTAAGLEDWEGPIILLLLQDSRCAVAWALHGAGCCSAGPYRQMLSVGRRVPLSPSCTVPICSCSSSIKVHVLLLLPVKVPFLPVS